ncbi:MAG: DUF3553 domain-containing protein [Phycisphaerales bacterium]|nr:DUF3553 domain-containing protein [Phycisphaerales bacterium]
MYDSSNHELVVGATVANAARPDWGVGTILRIEQTRPSGDGPLRVTVQFAVGSRVVQVPPAVLAPPRQAAQRDAGWLDKLAGKTLDDALRAIPEDIAMHLGLPSEKLRLIARLYAFDDDPAAIQRWAMRQSGVGDPLQHWTRDELAAAFAGFCRARDEMLRETAGRIRRSDGAPAIDTALADVPPRAAERMRAVITPMR